MIGMAAPHCNCEGRHLPRAAGLDAAGFSGRPGVERQVRWRPEGARAAAAGRNGGWEKGRRLFSLVLFLLID
jgi:hypothetical protein